MLLFTFSAHAATLTVTSLADSGTGTLRKLIADAAAGDAIEFSVAGTIVLTNGALDVSKNLSIYGPGASALIISGNNATRVMYLRSNVTVTIIGVTIVNGLAAAGGGIYNDRGTLSLYRCTLTGNYAAGPSASPYSGNPGTNGWGGAVFNNGTLSATDCTFHSNSVTGGAGSGAWPSIAGAAGGDGGGGACANFGALVMTGCLLAGNSALGGMGGSGMAGFYGCPGEPGGAGGNGGSGTGGALFNAGVASLVNSTFTLNTAQGGQGGSGGSGGPPSSQSCPTGNGGHGGVGGSGFAAIYDSSGQSFLTNCTICSNVATPGAGGAGGPPGYSPYPRPGPIGSPGGNGSAGAPGAALGTNGTHLLNTLLSGNTPSNGLGTLYDHGCNLSSDASCTFTNAGSLINSDPKLGPLSDNGGPTRTIPLLPLSPAIDSGSAIGSPGVDQRGISRPQGATADIGAYEYQFVQPQIVRTECLPGASIGFRAHGLPNRNYLVQTSTDFSNWADTQGLVADSAGVLQFTAIMTNTPARFYRLKMVQE